MPSIQQLKQLQDDYKAAFSTENGKRVLKDLERLCFIHGVTFSVNPHVTSFNEGKRAVVIQIQNMISMDIEQLRKQIERETEENAL